METILKQVISQLSEQETTLLKSTIKQGYWGSGDYEFISESGNIETTGMHGYITNDTTVDGLTRKQLPVIYKSIYKKLCNDKGIGRYISHCSDWWGDGSGDMLFIRGELDELFRKWSKEQI